MPTSTKQPHFDLLPPLESLQWLQGSPTTDLVHDLHLALLIQPNCPGCHSGALPVANELYAATQQQEQQEHDNTALNFDVYCLSTAFEDFAYNTRESTEKLLAGSLVGVAKQRLGPTAPTIPQMPVALDIVTCKTDASQELVDMALQATTEHAREQLSAGLHPPGSVERLLHTLGPKFLPAKLATVFYASRAQGTPTWVLHDKTGQVLASYTGQKTQDQVLAWIETAVREK